MPRTEGIIFDCDGVLFESRRANLAYYNAVLEHFDVPPVLPEEVERAHLCHTADSTRVFNVLVGPERAGEALALASRQDFLRFVPEMEPEAGLFEALSFLSERLPLAVATNRGHSMPEILRHFKLEQYFSVVVTSRDVARPKPYPDMLLMAAKRMGVSLERLLFVGDSELDHAAATAAGIRFVSYKGLAGGDLEISGHHELVDLVGRELGVNDSLQSLSNQGG